MKNEEFIIQIENSQLAYWASEFALDERFTVLIEETETDAPNPDKIHPSYSLEYGEVANIIVQVIGTVGALITIYDKVVTLHKNRAENVEAELSTKDIEPVLIIRGKTYLLNELNPDKLAEIQNEIDREAEKK